MAVITVNGNQLLVQSDDPGEGFYPKAIAARLARVPTPTLGLWDKKGIVPALTRWTDERGKESYGYTFEGLVYLRLIRLLRSMQPRFPMRKVIDTVKWLVDTVGPPSLKWADARIVSDQRDLWIRHPVIAAASRSGQMPFPGFVLFDQEFERFAERQDALLVPNTFMRWVSIEPSLRNGMPVIKNTGIETATIHAAFRQGLTTQDVKRRYPFLREPQIRHSERYELSLDEPIGRAA